jgi:hypothetical protein
MKAKLGRTARGWSLVLLALNGVLLVTMVWLTLASNKRRADLKPSQAADLSRASIDRSHAVVIQSEPLSSQPSRRAPIPPWRVSVPDSATGTEALGQGSATQVTSGLLKGIHAVNFHSVVSADGGRIGPNDRQ